MQSETCCRTRDPQRWRGVAEWRVKSAGRIGIAPERWGEESDAELAGEFAVAAQASEGWEGFGDPNSACNLEGFT